SDGTLSPVSGSPFAAGGEPVAIRVAPSAGCAYVANQASNNVSAYHVEADGSLKQIPGSPFPTEVEPSSVETDANGKFVYVVNRFSGSLSGSLSAYHVSSNGVLTPVSGSPFPTGAGPSSVACGR